MVSGILHKPGGVVLRLPGGCLWIKHTLSHDESGAGTSQPLGTERDSRDLREKIVFHREKEQPRLRIPACVSRAWQGCRRPECFAGVASRLPAEPNE